MIFYDFSKFRTFSETEKENQKKVKVTLRIAPYTF